MKRLIGLFLVLLLIFLFGCTPNADYISPIEVFYTCKTVDFHSEYGTIGAEIREYSGWEGKTREFLNQYLSGPNSENLTSPFPPGAWILDITQEESIVRIHLNNMFSLLSPNECSLACACISLTVFNLLNSETVIFQISGDQQIITMTRDNLLFYDDTYFE